MWPKPSENWSWVGLGRLRVTCIGRFHRLVEDRAARASCPTIAHLHRDHYTLITIFGVITNHENTDEIRFPDCAYRPTGSFRLGGRHDADRQPLPHKLVDKFRSGQRDIIWLEALLEVLTYFRDEFATQQETKRLFTSTLPRSEQIIEMKERRKSLKREKLEAKKQRLPRFKHLAVHPRGTKTRRQKITYAHRIYARHEERRVEETLELMRTSSSPAFLASDEQEMEWATEESIREALEQA